MEQLPIWNAVGIEPPLDITTNGWQPGMKPSAQHMNWLFNRAYKALQELQLNTILKEQKGAANGVATLDALKKIPLAQFPKITSNEITDKTVTNLKLADDIKVGSLANLTTTQKANVVAAINEILSGLTSHTGNTGVHINSTERTRWNGAQLTKLTQDAGHAKGLPSSKDANDITEPGFYLTSTDALNVPATLGTLMHIERNSGFAIQIHWATADGKMNTRYKNNSTWSAWAPYETAASVDSKIDAVKNAAQMKKITLDSGGVTINNQSTTTNLLDLIVSRGIGAHTFYSINGGPGNPPGATSVRGIAHMTNTNNGWVIAVDYLNNWFVNFIDAGNWRGWKRLGEDSLAQMFKLTQDNGRLKTTTVTDLNNLIESGFYYCGSGVIDNKPMSSIGTMIVMQYGSSTTMQLFISMGSVQRMFARYLNNGTWGSWWEYARSVDLENTNSKIGTINTTILDMQDHLGLLRPYEEGSVVTNYMITLLNGVTPYNDTLGRPVYRKTGKIVEIFGYVTGITAANTKIANIPVGFRPPMERYCAGITSTVNTARFARWKLMTNGDLIMENTNDGQFNVNSNTFWEFHFIYSVEEVAFG
ncbi:hypothetical protein H9636_07040 [Ureibacillus sp. Re31]|uniref:Uncharacterized protein n=1 Tax=Ureibacillus galli TaxID=2762222 RepID=A0ABR8XB64_9BACL|nr:pyocin knob domain-containing protein [Ureibacillus galli]MBD8026412.1 hypothetical protein [Ureibacillus galli]